MDPIRYDIDVQTPFQAALAGYGAGQAIRNDQLQMQQQQAAQQQALQMRSDLAAVVGKKDAGSADYIALMTKYPQLSEQLKRPLDALNAAQQQSRLQHGTTAYAAMLSGRDDIAERIFRDRAAAARNAGAEDEAKQHDTMADMIKTHAPTARTSVALGVAAQMGPEKFAETFGKLESEARARDLHPDLVASGHAAATKAGVEAQNAPEAARLSNENIKSEIQRRADQSRLEADKLTSEYEAKLYELNQKATTLDPAAVKLVNDFTLGAVAADQSAGQSLDLADRFEKLVGVDKGLAGKWGEQFKNLSGSQDAVSQLRQEYTRLRSSAAIKSLPPGPATDADINLALKGLPEENANPAAVASFLRGMSKLQRQEAAMNSAQAEWVNAVGGLIKPKKDIEVDGIKVPAGTTFVDFSRQFMKRRTDELGAKQATQQVQNRGYMRFAQSVAAPGGAPAPGTMGSGTFGVR